MKPGILIFGAGKIGRGFIAHLFQRAGYALTFIDPADSVVEQLNRDKSYPLHVMGRSPRTELISIERALPLSDQAAIDEAVFNHDLIATAVGGPNLELVGQRLGPALAKRLASGKTGAINIIVCENYKHPAALLRNAIYAAGGPTVEAWGEANLGIAETQVLRSCIEPNATMKQQNPLSVQVQDWWTLPCDGEAFRGTPLAIEGLALKKNFQNELIRKVYTYNCSNATIAYLGYLRGYTMLYEAAHDADILAVTDTVYAESGVGLIAEYDLDQSEQKALQELAISKYQDRTIADTIERNGRDSRRKLSPTDRLLGPALLCQKHGGTPAKLGLAIAAGLHYALSDDPGTQSVQTVLRRDGLRAAIQDVCQLDPDSPIGRCIQDGAKQLHAFNRINIPLYQA